MRAMREEKEKKKTEIQIAEVREAEDELAQMVVQFRAELRSYRGRRYEDDTETGRAEMQGYLDARFPVFAARAEGEYAGYMVCREVGDVVWVESLYVKDKFRGRGVADALHREAEKLAAAHGEDTLYHYVHPNNHRMIAFLRKKGYTVLNLIEIRRPHRGEVPQQVISVGDCAFDY